MLSQEQKIRNKSIKSANQIYHRLVEKFDDVQLQWLEFREWYLHNISQGKEVHVVDFKKPLALENLYLAASVEGHTPRVFPNANHISKKKNRIGWVTDIRFQGKRYSKYSRSYDEAVNVFNKMVTENHLPLELKSA